MNTYTKKIPEAVSQSTINRFWSKVKKTDGCWLWTAYKTPITGMRGGYGQFGIGEEVYIAHRVSWHISIGPIPDGIHVLHNCPGGDNPTCVNPSHLFLGTHLDNMRDRDAKKRLPVGEDAFASKLTEDEVRALFSRSAAGEQSALLAKDFGISQGEVSMILNGKRWSHLGLHTGLMQARGGTLLKCKVTEDKAEEIFALRILGTKGRDVAKMFGLSEATVSRVFHQRLGASA